MEAAGGWLYTARPSWSSAGESTWMRLAKFSLCNRLSLRALAVLFALDGDSAASVDLRLAARWKLDALATVLEISAGDVRAGFCAAPARQASSQLRHCPACLALGFHAAWFQSLLVEHCPLHRLPIKTGCAKCAAAVPYALGHDLATHPLTCAACACAWVPALVRPGGRCAPLGQRTTRRLSQWAAFVGHVAAGEVLPSRDQDRRRFLATIRLSSSARPHPVTTVNRLFDVPPPLTASLLARRPSHLQSRLHVAGDDLPAAAHALSAWPHFGRRFAQCEEVLRDARRQLFGILHDEDEPGRWRWLLRTGLVMPSDTVDRATAAMLGWSIAWTSPVRALAPSSEAAMPAFGLAAWLAYLPLRPPRTPRHQWHLQVLQWLAEDLVLSAWVWSRLAAFMHGKGFYVLHGALGHPKDLAQWRCHAGSAGGMFTSNAL